MLKKNFVNINCDDIHLNHLSQWMIMALEKKMYMLLLLFKYFWWLEFHKILLDHYPMNYDKAEKWVCWGADFTNFVNSRAQNIFNFFDVIYYNNTIVVVQSSAVITQSNIVRFCVNNILHINIT